MRLTVSALLLGLMTAPALALENMDVLGRAYALEGGKLLYSEHHHCDDVALRCQVLYRDENGGVFVRKELDYSVSPRSPRVRVIDLRTGTEIDAVAEPAVVMDAGFDNFVRESWDSLVDGREIGFPFQVVGRDKPLRMAARAVEGDGCGGETLCLEVRPEAWLLDLLLDPIELTYDRKQRRLLRFRGLGNIRDEQGNLLRVDIRYSYPEAPVVTNLAVDCAATQSSTLRISHASNAARRAAACSTTGIG